MRVKIENMFYREKITPTSLILVILITTVSRIYFEIYYPNIATDSSKVYDMVIKKQSSTLETLNEDTKYRNFTNDFFHKSCYSNSLQSIYYFKQFINEDDNSYEYSKSNSSCFNFLKEVSKFFT